MAVNNIKLMPVSALYKVLPNAEPFCAERGSFLRGESYDFQIAYFSDHVIRGATIRAYGELAPFLSIPLRRQDRAQFQRHTGGAHSYVGRSEKFGFG